MIFHGTVDNITDPENRGRVRVRIAGFDETTGTDYNLTPWCHACSPFAGDLYGLFIVPQVGDEAIVAQAHSGDWVVLGYHWSGRKAKPSEGSANVRVFKTPSGHKLSFAESGSILIQTAGGSKIELKANGDIDVMAMGNLNLNGTDGKVVTTEHICAYTGSKHAQGSSTVKADK